jgi:hypothetical protein
MLAMWPTRMGYVLICSKTPGLLIVKPGASWALRQLWNQAKRARIGEVILPAVMRTMEARMDAKIGSKGR